MRTWVLGSDGTHPTIPILHSLMRYPRLILIMHAIRAAHVGIYDTIRYTVRDIRHMIMYVQIRVGR
jgi:hypothetical protein